MSTRSGQRTRDGLSDILHGMGNPPFDFAIADYPLAPASLYGVGGPARLALLPRNREEVLAAYDWMRTQDAPKLVLGGGSNVLIADAGFPGIVIFTTHLRAIERLDGDRYAVEGGAILDDLVRNVIVENRYHGAGGLTGIPGTVGGAIYMNAGTVNGSICELMDSVDIVTEDGPQSIAMDASLYGYRGQTFCPPAGLILGGTFAFRPAEDDPKAVYDHYIERRRQTQPQGHSCGSVFKNPPGEHAGRLLESAGLKGTRIGGAIISDLHANFIVNDRDASSQDILDLIDLGKRTVHDKFGIALEEEVKIFGVR